MEDIERAKKDEEQHRLVFEAVTSIFDKQSLKIDDSLKDDIRNMTNPLLKVANLYGPVGEQANSDMEIYANEFNKLLQRYKPLTNNITTLVDAIEKNVIGKETPAGRAEFIKEYTDRVLGGCDIPLENYHDRIPTTQENESLFNEIENTLKQYGPLLAGLMPQIKQDIRNTKMLHNVEIPINMLEGAGTDNYLKTFDEFLTRSKGPWGQKEQVINDEIIIKLANIYDKLTTDMPKGRADELKQKMDDKLKTQGLDRKNWQEIQSQYQVIEDIITNLETIANKQNLGQDIGASNAVKFKKKVELIKQSLKNQSTIAPSIRKEFPELLTPLANCNDYNIRGRVKEKVFTQGLEELKNWCISTQKELNNPKHKLEELRNVIDNALKYIGNALLYGLYKTLGENITAGEGLGNNIPDKFQEAQKEYRQSVQIFTNASNMHNNLKAITQTVSSYVAPNKQPPVSKSSIVPSTLHSNKQSNKQGPPTRG